VIIAKGLANWLSGFFKYCFLRTQKNIVTYIHYREKAMKHGHDYKSPLTCTDGVCHSYQARIS
jgi:hypothetical protein